MTEIIVPVGYPGGALHPGEGQSAGTSYTIIVGQNLMAKPSEDYYTAWKLLFSDPETHRQLNFTREHYLKLAEDARIHDPTELLNVLEERGACASFEVDTESSFDFLKKHQLQPQGNGLGNTPDDPYNFRIQTGEQAVLTVMPDVYNLWLGAGSWPSMWATYQAYVKTPTESHPLSPQQIGHLFAASIPVIVASGAGFVMRAP